MQRPGWLTSDRFLAGAGLLAASVWPIADVALANPNTVDQSSALDALRWIAFLVAVSGITSLVLQKPLRSWTRASASIAALQILFFNYATLEPALRAVVTMAGLQHGAAILFSLLWLCAVPLILILSRERSTQRLILAAAIVMCLSTGLLALNANRGTPPSTQSVAIPARQLTNRPNIYEFIFDGMGRPDVLQSALGLDLSWVDPALEVRGFTVASRAEATYLSTIPSIHSILNPSDHAPATKVEFAHSEVVKFFRSHGYRYNHYGEVFSFSACSGLEDFCLSSQREGVSEIDVMMLRKTPIYAFLQRRILGATSSRNLPANLTRIASRRNLGPTLTISYMTPPHPPFIFSANCVADQTDFNDFRAWRTASIPRYGIGYLCVMNSALKAFDDIISRDPTAIILVSGDHGTMFHGRPGKKGWTPAGLKERRPVLLAARLPEKCRASFAGITRLPDAYPTLTRCLS